MNSIIDIHTTHFFNRSRIHKKTHRVNEPLWFVYIDTKATSVPNRFIKIPISGNIHTKRETKTKQFKEQVREIKEKYFKHQRKFSVSLSFSLAVNGL